MKKTKDRILSVALKLLNERGFSKVSLRDIAGEMNISLGNLTYHFKRKKDLIDALSFEYSDVITSQLVRSDSNLDLNSFFEILDIVFEAAYKYRFIYLDHHIILDPATDRGILYRNIISMRYSQLMALAQLAHSNDILIAERYDGEYRNLILRVIMILNTYYTFTGMSSSIVPHPNKDGHKTMLYHELMPYLTDSGKEFLLKILRPIEE